MKRLVWSVLATAVLVFAPLACDLQKVGNQISAKKVMIGTMLSTPDVAVSPAAVVGWDGGVPDGGQSLTVPGQTVAFVFFGTRQSDNGIPEPLSNATVRLQGGDAGTVTLPSQGAGTYGRNSADTPSLRYQSGVTYRFTATQGNETFVGQVDESPVAEKIAELHPPEGYVQITAGQGFSFRRAAVPTHQQRNPGFVTVVPLSRNGDTGAATYTNAPKEPLDFLKVVASPTEWTTDKVDIPGSAFPQPGQMYLVIFQSVKTGGPESDNLFIGSPMLAGTADIGVVRTR